LLRAVYYGRPFFVGWSARSHPAVRLKEAEP
jgi:hypothetical protein